MILHYALTPIWTDGQKERIIFLLNFRSRLANYGSNYVEIPLFIECLYEAEATKEF